MASHWLVRFPDCRVGRGTWLHIALLNSDDRHNQGIHIIIVIISINQMCNPHDFLLSLSSVHILLFFLVPPIMIEMRNVGKEQMWVSLPILRHCTHCSALRIRWFHTSLWCKCGAQCKCVVVGANPCISLAQASPHIALHCITMSYSVHKQGLLHSVHSAMPLLWGTT